MKHEYTLIGQDLTKINLRKLDIIPFKRYRFEPEEELEDEEWEYESHWTDALLPLIGVVLIAAIGFFM